MPRSRVRRAIRFAARLLIGLVLVFVLPLALRAAWHYSRDDLPRNWGSADWSSAGLLPPAAQHEPALVRIYAARTGQWRGIVADHAWIVVKERGASRYARFDKVRWGRHVREDMFPPDARWYSNLPQTVLALDGPEAERLIPRIRAAVADYPYSSPGAYRAWPGPNSNTFVAHVLAEVPELGAALPPTALGKDWLPAGDVVALTPSRTGLRLSIGGYAGLTLAWVEGVELNFLGVVAGLDLRRPALKVPGWGRLDLTVLRPITY